MAQRIGTRLFVSRLSSYTTTDHLKELFSPFGIVTEASLVKDGKTQRPKGYGFVSYRSEIEAEKALKAMNGRAVWFIRMQRTDCTFCNASHYAGCMIHENAKNWLRPFSAPIVDGRLIFVEPAIAKRPGEDGTA